MPSSAHAWTVLCRACDIVIGTVEEGRFVHDPTCARPLAIGAGVMRCCACGGRLSADQRLVVGSDLIDDIDDDEDEDVAPAIVLRFMRPSLAEGDARQRL
jgi:hypothetical protein